MKKFIDWVVDYSEYIIDPWTLGPVLVCWLLLTLMIAIVYC